MPLARKIYSLFLLCVLICSSAAVIHSQETTVGGHVKLTLYDFTDGKKNGVKGNEYAGMALTEMIIYISSELTDKISVDLQPLFNNYTGATPRFKSDNIWKFKKSSQSGKPTFNPYAILRDAPKNQIIQDLKSLGFTPKDLE